MSPAHRWTAEDWLEASATSTIEIRAENTCRTKAWSWLTLDNFMSSESLRKFVVFKNHSFWVLQALAPKIPWLHIPLQKSHINCASSKMRYSSWQTLRNKEGETDLCNGMNWFKCTKEHWNTMTLLLFFWFYSSWTDLQIRNSDTENWLMKTRFFGADFEFDCSIQQIIHLQPTSKNFLLHLQLVLLIKCILFEAWTCL